MIAIFPKHLFDLHYKTECFIFFMIFYFKFVIAVILLFNTREGKTHDQFTYRSYFKNSFVFA